MKPSNVIKRYQELYDDTLSKIEHLNKVYCEEFNSYNPKIYNMLCNNFSVGDSEYVIFNKTGLNHSGISTIEMKNVALQNHFNYLSVIAHEIESRIYEMLVDFISGPGDPKIEFDDISIVYEDSSVVFIKDNVRKSFINDLTTEEQLNVYYHTFKPVKTVNEV